MAICKRHSRCHARTIRAISARSALGTAHGDHEGYTGGYFLESAINHYQMTDKKDARLYNAAQEAGRLLGRIWVPRPRSPGTTAIRRWSRRWCASAGFVNDMEGGGQGRPIHPDRRNSCSIAAHRGRESDARAQRVRPEPPARIAAVRSRRARGARNLHVSGMADVAVETHDPDYQSAVKSLWDNIVNKKYYLTGGIGSGETSEGFGPNYSLRNNSYCESCSSCGMIFFHWKMNLAYHDAMYADHYEETMYNALLGSHRSGRAGTSITRIRWMPAAPQLLAQLPVLRRQYCAHSADGADVDLRHSFGRHLREPVHRQHRTLEPPPAPISKSCRRPIIRGAGKSRSR